MKSKIASIQNLKQAGGFLTPQLDHDITRGTGVVKPTVIAGFILFLEVQIP